jgi:hypothetical protein
MSENIVFICEKLDRFLKHENISYRSVQINQNSLHKLAVDFETFNLKKESPDLQKQFQFEKRVKLLALQLVKTQKCLDTILKKYSVAQTDKTLQEKQKSILKNTKKIAIWFNQFSFELLSIFDHPLKSDFLQNIRRFGGNLQHTIFSNLSQSGVTFETTKIILAVLSRLPANVRELYCLSRYNLVAFFNLMFKNSVQVDNQEIDDFET